MRLTTPQIISLYGLAMGFTRDAQFEILSISPMGDATIKVSNSLGERGFLVSVAGGPPEEIRAMRRASAALHELVGSPTALEQPDTIVET